MNIHSKSNAIKLSMTNPVLTPLVEARSHRPFQQLSAKHTCSNQEDLGKKAPICTFNCFRQNDGFLNHNIQLNGDKTTQSSCCTWVLWFSAELCCHGATLLGREKMMVPALTTSSVMNVTLISTVAPGGRFPTLMVNTSCSTHRHKSTFMHRISKNNKQK